MNAAAPAIATRYLTFEVGAGLYALPAQSVLEVIRVPAVARVPQGPRALLGVANLRGAVLPVADLRVMLGNDEAAAVSQRAIVLDLGTPIAIVVDAVATLESADMQPLTQPEQEGGAQDGQHILGAFTVAGTQRVARVLDIRALLDAAFARRTSAPTPRARDRATVLRRQEEADVGAEMLVTFEVAGQEFALPLSSVQEILPIPRTVTLLARAESAVLGLTSVRDRLLPLLSLRALLGFDAVHEAADRQKVLVLKLGDARIGLVADRARAVVSAQSSRVDPVPAVLAARTGGESRIRAVYRGEGGQRLVAILSPEQLFRNEVMPRLTADGTAGDSMQAAQAPASQERTFLVFRLGDDEYGLPIETVVEVAQVPAQITRVPRTPKFLEGVVNLRGEVLPVVDQRRRFDMPPLATATARRLVVVKTARHRAGLIVDGVSDVLRTSAAQIAPPPELTDATSALVSGVLNLAQSQRMVLLLDPAELLTRAEQGLLDAFQSARKKAGV